MNAPDFPPEVIEKAALALFVKRYDRQPIPESFDDSRHHDCRVFARAVLAAVATAEGVGALLVALKKASHDAGDEHMYRHTLAALNAGNCGESCQINTHDDYLRAEGVECCCETSPPEFGGPIPERDCPLHGEPSYQRGMVEGARQVRAAVEQVARVLWEPFASDEVRAAREAVTKIEKEAGA